MSEDWEDQDHAEEQPSQQNIQRDVYRYVVMNDKENHTDLWQEFSTTICGFLTETCTLVSWPPDDAHCTGLMIQWRALLSTPSRRTLRWRHLEREGSTELAGSCHTVVVAKAGETFSARAHPTVALHARTTRQKNNVIFFDSNFYITLRGIILSCFCNGWYHTKQRPILIWGCKSIRP